MLRDKVVFLDMDGVLVTQRSHHAFGSNLLMRHIDPVACKLVERLCKENSAKIVLSSTWRVHFDLGSMTSILMNGGFSDIPWHQNWKTPHYPSLRRGLEIQAWLNANDNPQAVILDDDNDMLEEQRGFFVQTSAADGFLWSHYEKASAILSRAHRLNTGKDLPEQRMPYSRCDSGGDED